MSTLTKTYIRTFITAALFFGGFMALFEFLEDGEIRWIKHIIGGVLFGLFMSFWNTWSAKRVLKEKGVVNPTEDDFRVGQATVIDSSLTSEQVLDLIKNDSETKDWKVETDGQTNLKGKTGLSWKSWGEKFSLKFQGNQISIESRPLIPTTILDGGKNLGNVQTLKRIIVSATS